MEWSIWFNLVENNNYYHLCHWDFCISNHVSLCSSWDKRFIWALQNFDQPTPVISLWRSKYNFVYPTYHWTLGCEISGFFPSRSFKMKEFSFLSLPSSLSLYTFWGKCVYFLMKELTVVFCLTFYQKLKNKQILLKKYTNWES